MTSPLNVSDSHAHWSPRLWGTLLVLCAAMFLDALDVSMVGVALPSIADDLGSSAGTSSATADYCSSAAARPICSAGARSS